MDSLISIAGSVASIGGAYWAFVEARNAAASAKKAEIVRNELIDRRELVEVSMVYTETQRILRIVGNIGPSCKAETLQGLNCANIAKELDEYSRFLNAQSAHFSEQFENKASTLCDDLKANIEALSEESKPKKIKEIGTNIYYKIYDFMPLAKELADKRQEHSVVNSERDAK